MSDVEHGDDDSGDNHRVDCNCDNCSAIAAADPPPAAPANCDPSYPTVCIRPPPPDLDCADVPYKNFRVLQPDPHRFDGNRDGFGCEG